MLNTRELTALFKERGFTPLKRLGENYLIDGNIKDKIIRAAELSPSDTVLEIGPGFGALTMDLARSGATVWAIEKDKKAFAILTEMLGAAYPKVTLRHEDILEFDMDMVPHSAGKIKVLGNLPYYITTPIIERLFGYRSLIDRILITVQREVAERFMAAPGTEHYGSISCFVHYYTQPTYIHTIKRTSFYPAPDVDSSFLRLDVLQKPPVAVRSEELLFKIVRGAFNQRRKSIINSLGREEVLNLPKEELAAVLSDIGISPAARPETLSLADFARIANAV